jgi:galactokinase
MKELTAFFREHYGFAPRWMARGPGRVNMLGEHVDYNDGMVLPAAIDRAVSLAAVPTSDGAVSLFAADLGKSVVFHLEALDHKVDIDGNPLPGWAKYPAGVAWALQRSGLEVKGIQAVYTSDVPIGSGLSSSAAVEMAFAALWQALGGWKLDPVELAKKGQVAENQYVGVSTGLMDQFASMCGVQDHLLYFDTRTLEWEPIPLPAGAAIVIADSGVRRSLVTSAYNERRASCEKAVALLQAYLPHIRALRDVSTVDFAAYSEFLPIEVRMRAEHIVKEIHRVQQAVQVLRRGEVDLFGGLMYAGHASLRDLYEVSCKELDILVRATREIPGCYGARLTGAGFGGCTVNLVAADQAEAFVAALHAAYQEQAGREAAIYICRASAGAAAWELEP